MLAEVLFISIAGGNLYFKCYIISLLDITIYFPLALMLR